MINEKIVPISPYGFRFPTETEMAIDETLKLCGISGEDASMIAIEVMKKLDKSDEIPVTIKDDTAVEAVDMAISAVKKQEQTKEVIPHRNYQYLSDYWCECGWHLGKYNDVKFCADCGRKINWGKRKYTHPEPYTEEES